MAEAEAQCLGNPYVSGGLRVWGLGFTWTPKGM